MRLRPGRRQPFSRPDHGPGLEVETACIGPRTVLCRTFALRSGHAQPVRPMETVLSAGTLADTSTASRPMDYHPRRRCGSRCAQSGSGETTAALADRFIAELSLLPSTSWRCSATTPRTDLRGPAGTGPGQLGISRVQIGGVLTSPRRAAWGRPEVDYPIKRDAQGRRNGEPVAAKVLLSAVDRARRTAPPRMKPVDVGVQRFDLTFCPWPVIRLAIPLAIRSLLPCWPGCNQADGELDSTCGDSPRQHQADGSCLTSNP